MTRCRARNWSQYNQSLVRQGSIFLWIRRTGGSTAWFADGKSGGGRPRVYSDAAIMALMIIKTVFGCGFRQLQGLMRDFLQDRDGGHVCPDYTTICRRGQAVKVPVKAHRKGPLHVVIDSTGLKVFGAGEWRLLRNKLSHHRGWVKLHVAICAETQQIVAASLTSRKTGDAEEMPRLLAGISGEIQEVIADGAYDTRGCYEAIASRGADPLIPPRKGAKKAEGDPVMEPRNRAIIRIRDQKRGKRRWKQERGYGRRSLVETVMHRLKAIGGPRLRARLEGTQLVEVAARMFVLNEVMALRQ